MTILGLTFFITSCATPKATLVTKEPLKRYKRVYLVSPDPDPRNVQPRVLTRLRALGFDVREVGSDMDPPESQGTAFVLTPQGHLLTCAHVLGTNMAATLWIRGQRFEAGVISKDTNADLALLKISGEANPPLKPLAISEAETLKLGQTVFTMGFPLTDMLGKNPRLSKGLVSATAGLEDNPHHLQISAEVQPGNSGGPLLTEDGRVAGIVVATLNPMTVLMRTGGKLPQNVNFAIKGDVARGFLKTNGIEFVSSASSPDDRASFENVQDSLALIRAGIIPPGEENLPELACAFSYLSFWDIWFRFRAFQISFFDMKSGKLLLKAGQYRDNPFSTEDSVLDRTFQQIRGHFFPETVAATEQKPSPAK